MTFQKEVQTCFYIKKLSTIPPVINRILMSYKMFLQSNTALKKK